MPHQLKNHSPDLQRLVAEGYELEERSGYLVVRSIPYLSANKAIRWGTIITDLDTSGGTTAPPKSHTVYFIGEMPHSLEGHPVPLGKPTLKNRDLGHGLIVDFWFSFKPKDKGYEDNYEKVTTYVSIISGPAQALYPSVTPRTFVVVEAPEEGTVFRYWDTATSRAGIGLMTEKLERVGAVAIVGLGGTGSYILDLIAKTPVREIRLFDGDKFGSHNAFRAPGAPSLELLQEAPQKVDYFQSIYSKMRRNIVTYGYVDESTVEHLKDVQFAFVSVDAEKGRKFVVEKLEEFGIPFIDVGMGVFIGDGEAEGTLMGQLRVSTSTDDSRDIVRPELPIADDEGGENLYDSNIQIAELNALNAVLAVIKWKKLLGFYHDAKREYSSLYHIDANHIINESVA